MRSTLAPHRHAATPESCGQALCQRLCACTDAMPSSLAEGGQPARMRLLAKVLAGFSAVVIFALIFSLIESKFILPTHLAYANKPESNNPLLRGWRWLRAQARPLRRLQRPGRSCRGTAACAGSGSLYATRFGCPEDAAARAGQAKSRENGSACVRECSRPGSLLVCSTPRTRARLQDNSALAELDLDLQAYLTRSFCILEIFAAVDAGATLLVQMHYLRAFGAAAELAANPVDAKKAQTRREKDKATIDGFVEAMPGGFETLNATITEAIKKAAAVIAEQFSASEIELQDKGLTAHDATVVAEILKSKTSVTSVDLGWNTEIGDEGAKALAEALKVNATVEKLYLSILEALGGQKRLKTLHRTSLQPRHAEQDICPPLLLFRLLWPGSFHLFSLWCRSNNRGRSKRKRRPLEASPAVRMVLVSVGELSTRYTVPFSTPYNKFHSYSIHAVGHDSIGAIGTREPYRPNDRPRSSQRPNPCNCRT